MLEKYYSINKCINCNSELELCQGATDDFFEWDTCYQCRGYRAYWRRGDPNKKIVSVHIYYNEYRQCASIYQEGYLWIYSRENPGDIDNINDEIGYTSGAECIELEGFMFFNLENFKNQYERAKKLTTFK